MALWIWLQRKRWKKNILSIWVERKMSRANCVTVLTLALRATGVRITVMAVDARANRLMIQCSTTRIETTCTDAWILATLRDAGTIRRTFLVDYAFWSAIWWRTEHSHGTRAYGTCIELTAFRVRTTWTWYAWMSDARWFDCYTNTRRNHTSLVQMQVRSELIFVDRGFCCLGLSVQNTYVSAYNGRMDRRDSLVGSYRLDDDWWLDIQHSSHTCPGMDHRISDGYRPNVVHIRHWPHILADSLAGHRCTLFGMSTLDDRQSHGTHYSVHMAMVRMDFVAYRLRKWKNDWVNVHTYFGGEKWRHKRNSFKKYSRWIGSNRQPVNGSPWWPLAHVHTGMWLTTSHSAFTPQTPGHGSRQCWRMQAMLLAQSAL